MAGDNQEPVKGDVRRFVQGGYKPVGATMNMVMTQGPDYDGMNRGFGMFLEPLYSSAKSRSGGSGKQDYSGQYQVEMNDIAANPLYHDASGMYNSKGREAIRALNQKYAPYVSGAEIRATEGHVSGGYKDSVDSALREVNIKQRAADYEAQNKRYSEMWDAAHPESIDLPFETRSALGKNMSNRANAIKSIATGLMNGDLSSISDPAIRQLAEYTLQNMSSEDIERLKTMGDTAEDQAKLTDFLSSLGVQLGSSQAEARVMAISASNGMFGYINKYRNDLQQLTDDELKYKKSLAANETFDQLPTSDQGMLSLTNQLSADTMARGLVGGFRVSDAFKTEKVGDKYRRVLITGDKKIIDFGLNYGNALTSSATLAGIVGKIRKAQEEGNSTPLMGLSNIPNLGGVMLAENGSEEFALAKQQLADCYSIEIARNARHYYKGNNEVNDDMRKQISDVINAASYLGYTNEECQSIVNKALETIGMKPIKGVHTPEELDHTVGASLTRLGDMIFGKKKEEPEEESNDFGVDVNDYLSEGNQVSMPTSEESGEPVNDEEAQMTKVDVYNNPEFIDFRNKIMQAAKNRQIEPDQAANEINLKEQEIKQRREQGLFGKTMNAIEGLFISKAEAQELSSINQDISEDMAQRMLNFTAKHESFVPHVYEDGIGKKQIGDERSVKGGNATIGFGKNLDTNPLTKKQLDYILIDGRPLTNEEKNGDLGKLLTKKGIEIDPQILKRITITKDNATKMLVEEMDKSWKSCKKYVKGFENLDPRAQEVCADIAYNAGPGFFTSKEHKSFVRELTSGNYASAAWYLERYLIAKQNPERTKDNVATLRSINKKKRK